MEIGGERAVERHFLGGIDEAGLGPILGPLVVAGVVLDGPKGENPWVRLDKVFCKKRRSRKDRRIRVDDSKRVKTGKFGRAQLERTALTLLLAAKRRLPENLEELFSDALGQFFNDRSLYPWYSELGSVSLPRWQDKKLLHLESHLAVRDMERASVHCSACVFHALNVGRFNQLIEVYDNKGLALFETTRHVIDCCLRVTNDAKAKELTLVIDRLGGRTHYCELLTKAWPKHKVQILAEGKTLSRYKIGKRCELLFAEKGEDRAFPTAAASCIAKYVRELCVDRINAWFTRKLPDLAPTAGYYTDGRRFLKDVASIKGSYPEGLLVRNR